MRKILFILLIGLMVAPSILGAKILVLSANPAATDCNDQTRYVLGRFAVLQKILGFEYDVVQMGDTIHIEGTDTDYPDFNVNISDYTLAIMLNLPDIDGALSTDAELLANGCGKIAKWVGTNDTLFTIPMLLAFPEYVYVGNGSDFDTTGAVAPLNNETTEVSSWVNCVGDSIYSTGHALTKPCPLIAYNGQLGSIATTIDPLVWIPGGASVTGDTIPCAFWKYEKANKHEVYVMSYAGESWHTPHWVDLIAAFEEIEPIRIGTHFNAFLRNVALTVIESSDTTGLGASIHETIDWMVANDWKAHVSMSTHYYDKWAGIDDVAAKVLSYPDIFRVTLDGYSADIIGYHHDYTPAQRRAAINVVFDEITGDAVLAGHIDTTALFAPSGYYGGDVSGDNYQLHEIIDDLNFKGIRNLYCFGNNNPNHSLWPDYDYGLEATKRFVYNGNVFNVYAMAFQAGVEFCQAGDDSISDVERGVNTAILLKEAMACRAGIDGGKAKVSSPSGWAVVNFGSYLPIFSYSYKYFGTRTQNEYTRSELADYSKSNILWALKETKLQIDWNNNICDYIQDNTRYETTRIVPFGITFIEDINYDRKLGRKWSNSHVKRN